MKRNIVAIAVIMAMGVWGCSKIDSGNSGLKRAVENGVASIDHAVSKISGTTGYQLLSMNDATSKSDFTFNDTIELSDVAGIYDFKPDTILRIHHFSPYRLFKKTGESADMVVNLPEAMVFHPKHLCFFAPLDTVYPNNFTITATDYHLYFNWWNSYEYKLTAGLSLDDKDAGSMDVSSTSHSAHTNSYASSYTFTNGYNIAAVWQDGDTATSAFSLSNGNDTLFRESNTFIWHDFHKTEKFYKLKIGSVELRKSTGVDSLQVFVNDVLQQNAARMITDDSDVSGSVCNRRDILLTYDDGTTARLSDIIAPVKEDLKSLRNSLHSMYFAKHIVDYIAFSIYYESHQYQD
jgi:hypothetical protein